MGSIQVVARNIAKPAGDGKVPCLDTWVQG